MCACLLQIPDGRSSCAVECPGEGCGSPVPLPARQTGRLLRSRCSSPPEDSGVDTSGRRAIMHAEGGRQAAPPWVCSLADALLWRPQRRTAVSLMSSEPACHWRGDAHARTRHCPRRGEQWAWFWCPSGRLMYHCTYWLDLWMCFSFSGLLMRNDDL